MRFINFITSIDTSLDKFQDMLFRAIDHHITQRTLKRRSRPPWIDNEIMKLIRKKKKLWKRLKTNGSADLFLKFKVLRRKTRSLLIQATNRVSSVSVWKTPGKSQAFLGILFYQI